MPTTSVEMPEGLKKRIEAKVKSGDYTSNSDFVRYAVRRVLDQETISPRAIAKLSQRMKYEDGELVDLDEA